MVSGKSQGEQAPAALVVAGLLPRKGVDGKWPGVTLLRVGFQHSALRPRTTKRGIVIKLAVNIGKQHEMLKGLTDICLVWHCRQILVQAAAVAGA